MRYYRLSFLFFYSTNIIYSLLYSNNGEIMKKRFKSKKKFNSKLIYIPIIFILIISILTYLNKKIRQSISNYSYIGIENTNITNQIYKNIKSNIFNSPVNLLKSELNYYNDEKETTKFTYVETKLPSIYIYNSHQGETYSREYLEEHNIVPDVLMASNMLKDKLEKNGINSIVEESDILAYMKQNNLNHAGSYKASRYFLNKAINNYQSVELFIDLHRDAATHQVSTTTINDKPCAKVLFVIGLENPNYEKNLKVVTHLNNIILEKYPSLTRGIMKKQGYGVNGIYNQDLRYNVILIEIGGNENNIEEVNNTLDLIAIVLEEYLNEKEEK